MEGLLVEPPDSDPGGRVLPSDVTQCLDGAGNSAHLDEQLVGYIRERGFANPVWEAFRTRLVVYGLGFVTPLIESGAIFAWRGPQSDGSTGVGRATGRPGSFTARLRPSGGRHGRRGNPERARPRGA